MRVQPLQQWHLHDRCHARACATTAMARAQSLRCDHPVKSGRNQVAAVRAQRQVFPPLTPIRRASHQQPKNATALHAHQGARSIQAPHHRRGVFDIDTLAPASSRHNARTMSTADPGEIARDAVRPLAREGRGQAIHPRWLAVVVKEQSPRQYGRGD
jgi:hypothetical protein